MNIFKLYSRCFGKAIHLHVPPLEPPPLRMLFTIAPWLCHCLYVPTTTARSTKGALPRIQDNPSSNLGLLTGLLSSLTS
jgi:hypothetical protein